ncbi:hypothetical protein ETD86_12295 [Nonomuraea turkmeniaca]|uniref:Uncharacterized protein n=1 Tax=Nonomuraea turkmeniaca TaxID=103838 RepID=A0A5S4FNL1_9ACTN|nr:hypothetical protein ETD86_12295 [Nonomuraea turkmeniaca]
MLFQLLYLLAVRVFGWLVLLSDLVIWVTSGTRRVVTLQHPDPPVAMPERSDPDHEVEGLRLRDLWLYRIAPES